MDKKYEDILSKVTKPARYTGGEYGIKPKKNKKNLSVCLAFPDIYEIGMSNLGLRILYGLINSKEEMTCERCFAPWLDMADLLRKEDYPLVSVDSKKSLQTFDVLGFSLQYELLYTNVLYMLELAKIPFYSIDRDESYPIIIAGGPCTANPEPIAAFFDLICIGEGEDVIIEVLTTVKKNKGNKERILSECSKIQGVYVPKIHKEKSFKMIKKAVVKDFENAFFPTSPLVPNIPIVHDRPVVELFRGCYSSCRFCQATFFYRPIRKRSPQKILDQSIALMDHTGYEELGLSSLSTGDYIGLAELVKKIVPEIEKRKIQLQLPSLRLDSFSEDLAKKIRKTGSLTFAPEAGTQRLRDVINKNITEENFKETLHSAFINNCKSVKLYFMVGLPTETKEDLAGIISMVNSVKEIYKSVRGKGSVNINVSTSVFIPKPVTPFQWCELITVEEMKDRHAFLKSGLHAIKGVKYSYSNELSSYMEAVLARGDNRLSKVIECAYKLGAIFDSWNDYFNIDRWAEAFSVCAVDPRDYTRSKNFEEILPWDFIDFGVSRTFLQKEHEKAFRGETTKSCKTNCKGCGANIFANCDIIELNED